MSLVPEFIDQRLRDSIAGQLGLRSPAMSRLITQAEAALAGSKPPLSTVAAIGVVEKELLAKSYDLELGMTKQDRTYHAIVEQMYFRRMNALGTRSVSVSPAERRELQVFLTDTYREFKDTEPSPAVASKMMPHELCLMEDAMWDCISALEIDTLEMHYARIALMCRLSYKGKLALLQYKTP